MSSKKHVAFVLPSFSAGGAQNVLLTLATSLDPTLFEPMLIVINTDGPWRERLPSGFPMISLERASLRAALPRLLRTLRAERPDIVVATLAYVNMGVCLIAPLLGSRPRIVVREANTPRQHAKGLLGRLGYWLGYRLLYRRADRVICPAGYLADELANQHGIAWSRIAVLPNPVDEQALRCRASQPRREPGPGQRFIAVGRLTRQKGYDRLLDDFAKLSGDSRLIILGDGEELDALAAQSKRLSLHNRVTFAGFDANPAPWLAGADALLLPSRWEGLPNVALEALACGTPVIATPQAGGIAEIAALASPQAVHIADPGADFVATMGAVAPRQDRAIHASLLPRAYCLAAVAEQFAALLKD